MKYVMGLAGFGLGITCALLALDYLNAGQATACIGQKPCTQKVLRAGGKDPEDVKFALVACGVGSVLCLWQATRND